MSFKYFKYLLPLFLIYACSSSQSSIGYNDTYSIDDDFVLPAQQLPNDQEKKLLNSMFPVGFVGVDSIFYEDRHITFDEAHHVIKKINLELYTLSISTDSLTNKKKLYISPIP